MGTTGRLLLEPNAEPHVLRQPHVWAGAQKKAGTHTHAHSSHTSSSQKVETTQKDRLFKHICLSREQYSGFRRRDIPTPSPTRTNPESITLSEVSQSQRGQCCVIPRAVPGGLRLARAESGGWLWGAGGGDFMFHGDRVPVLQDESVLELLVEMVAQ